MRSTAHELLGMGCHRLPLCLLQPSARLLPSPASSLPSPSFSWPRSGRACTPGRTGSACSAACPSVSGLRRRRCRGSTGVAPGLCLHEGGAPSLPWCIAHLMKAQIEGLLALQSPSLRTVLCGSMHSGTRPSARLSPSTLAAVLRSRPAVAHRPGVSLLRRDQRCAGSVHHHI